MITCVKKLSIIVVRALSFLVNSFEKLFLSQDTFFKITILIFSLVLSNLFFEVQLSYALKPTPSLSVSLLSNSSVEINSDDIFNNPDKSISIPILFNVKTNNSTGFHVYPEVEKNYFNDIVNLSNINRINSLADTAVAMHLSDLLENTFAGTKNCLPDYLDQEMTDWHSIPLVGATTNVLQINQNTPTSDEGDKKCFALGLHISNNLPVGTYQNKIIITAVANNYQTEANLISGSEFRQKTTSLLAAPVDSVNKIKHLERSLVAPPEGATVIHLEINETSDHAVLAWLDKDTQTLYYYSEAEKLYLNPDCSNMFSYLGVEYLDLRPFDSSRVTNMNFMFANMYNAKEIDFSHFSTSNVTDMGRLFWKSWDLKKLDLSSFDTSKVIYMNAMFIECYRLEELNLSSFDTGEVWYMGSMFKNTFALKNLDIHNFNTPKVRRMQQMFYASGIKELDLSNFNTSNVEDMSEMFKGMNNLETLDISNFNTSKVSDFSGMFATGSTDKLERIYVKQDFDTSSGTYFTNIFRGRTTLRGGEGSFLPDPSTADKTWLRIDDSANGRPGYFTRKV